MEKYFKERINSKWKQYLDNNYRNIDLDPLDEVLELKGSLLSV